ncbi:MAG: DsbA family protein [Candidatus Dasytiphilus stammeri]
MKLKNQLSFLSIFLFLIYQMVIAAPLINEEQYVALNKPILGIPQVVEFFSFLCPHCYQLESIFHHKKISSHMKMVKYHVAFTENELFLTQAWSVAIALGIENSVILPIFQTIINNNFSYNDILEIFVNLGISKKDYNYLWNSYTIRLLSLKQEQLAQRIGLQTIPTIVINGKYLLKNDVIRGFYDYKTIITYLYNLH